MENIIIGCSNQDNVVHFLKDIFNVVTPYVHYKKGYVIKNFDIYFNFDGTIEDTRLYQMHGIPQFGHRRMGKYEQALHFARMGINTPNTYKVALDVPGGGRFDAIYNLLSDIHDDEKFILKAENGARGIGQCLVNKNELYKLVDMCNNPSVDVDEIIKRFEIGAKDSFKGDHEKEYIKSIINGDDFIIQEKVNLKAEWRFVYFYKNTPMLIRRSVDGTWQANTSVTGKGEVEEFDSQNNDHVEMLEIAQILGKDLHAPFLSIDFYKDSGGNIGCFEQQMQFGYAIMPKNQLVQRINQSVSFYLKDHFTQHGNV